MAVKRKGQNLDKFYEEQRKNKRIKKVQGVIDSKNKKGVKVASRKKLEEYAGEFGVSGGKKGGNIAAARKSPLEKAKIKIAEKKKTPKGKKIVANLKARKEVKASPKESGWYPGKRIVERRKKRIKEGKWVLGEKLTESGRKRATARQAGKRLKKAGVKVTTKEARLSGKVRKGVLPLKKGSVRTKEAGVFPAYEKKSKAAGSFRSAFKSNCAGKGAGDSFSWDGRSYSCARASDKKKTKKVEKKVKVASGPSPQLKKDYA